MDTHSHSEIIPLSKTGAFCGCYMAVGMMSKYYPEQVGKGDTYDIACLYPLISDSDSAFKFLQNLEESKGDRYEHTLNDPDLNSLHADNR